MNSLESLCEPIQGICARVKNKDRIDILYVPVIFMKSNASIIPYGIPQMVTVWKEAAYSDFVLHRHLEAIGYTQSCSEA